MLKQITFFYQGKIYSATYVVSIERFPFYIFVSFLHPDLTQKFGEDIAIKSDGKKVLSELDVPKGINELRRTLFFLIDEIEQLNSIPMPKLEEWQKGMKIEQKKG